MSDNSNDAEGKGAGKKKGKGLMLIILVVVLVAGGGGAYFFLKPALTAKASSKKSKKTNTEKADDDSGNQDGEPDDEHADDEDGKASKDGKSKSGAAALMLSKDKDVKRVVELQPFILNLADKEENRFLRLTLNLGIGEAGEEKPDSVFISRVRNAVLAVLMTRTSADVLSPEGKISLRKDLLQAVRAAVEEPRVIAIYITELIVQR